MSGLTTTRTILIITTAVLGAAAIALGLMAFGVIQNPFPTSWSYN